MNEDNWCDNNHHHALMFFLLITLFCSKIMPLFTICNNKEITLSSRLKFVFFLFNIFKKQKIKGDDSLIIRFKLFPIFFFVWWKTYFFSIIIIYKRFNLRYFFCMIFHILIVLVQLLQRGESIIIFGIYCCLFVFYPIRRIYIRYTTI